MYNPPKSVQSKGQSSLTTPPNYNSNIPKIARHIQKNKTKAENFYDFIRWKQKNRL
jgi:hypothetical protein